MFKVFSGSWRGLGKSEEVLFMQVGFEFRNLLKHFKGSALSVFLCIVLHSDQDGKSHPGYEVIQKETGLSRDSISKALDQLTKIVIEDQRVLLRYRIRNKKTKAFIGSNHYIVFPASDQIALFDGKDEWIDPDQQSQSPKNPTSANQDTKQAKTAEPESVFSDVGKPDLKNNHIDKKNKSMEREQPKPPEEPMGANAPARSLPALAEERAQAFPEDCRAGAGLMFEIFNLIPPERPAPDAKGGDFALWINGLRGLAKLATEYNTPLKRAMELAHAHWNRSPFNLAHPAALKKVMVSALATAFPKQSKTGTDGNVPQSVLQDFKPRRHQ
jgi:hypothetical protein